MGKLYSLTQATAQARADSLHTRMLATDPAYAASVARGQTLRWCQPLQDMSIPAQIGDLPVPLSAFWYCRVNARCAGVLTGGEQTKLVIDSTLGALADTID